MPVNETSVISKPKPKPKGKRTPPEKESKSVTHGSEAKPKSADTTPVASTSVQKVPPVEWFTSEIQTMMYGFGDCRRPLLESAQLVEEIVHQQMNSLLVQASEIASGRGARFIGSEDIIFLLRKDKIKLSRLLKYLEVKDLKAGLLKNIPVEEELGELTDGSVAGEAKTQPQRPKRVKLCSDFLSSIDQTGELTTLLDEEIFDEVKTERLLRRDRQTRCMDQAQYLDYADARQMTFCRKYRTTKFRDWLLKDNLTDVKPNALAIELFNYLAFETVAQIVDLSLLVKQDALEDPFSRLHPTAICNTEYPSVQMAGYNVRTTTNASETLSQTSSSSPPSSPASQAGGSHPQAASAQPSIAAKPKPKKVKKTVGKAPQEFPGCKCIQPADIREAIRRYWRESGPFLLFSKVHRSNMCTRLLCC